MSAKNKKRFSNAWQSEFLITMLATAIGLGLTFAVDRMVENHKSVQAQRQTAIMVIDDIDKSIATLKNIRDNEDKGYNATLYLLECLDSLETVPDSMLNQVFNYLCEGSVVSTDLEFDESVEKMYHSAQEARNNLSDIPFIRNVEEFYKTRTLLRNSISTFAYWKKPVPKAETDAALMNPAVIDSREGFCNFLKNKLTDEHSTMYVKSFFKRIRYYNETLEEWTNKNEENKFLMNITDKELKEFIRKTSKQVTTAHERDVIGSWISSGVDAHVTELEFRRDHTFTYVQEYTINHSMASGKAILWMSYTGEWAVKRDSLVLTAHPQTIQIDVDGSRLAYRKELADSIRHDLQRLKDEQTPVIRQAFMSEGMHAARATNIDKSGTRLELTDAGQRTTHYQRKQE